uniref:Golgin A4 n=1 Tax=Propithecus coquereli TaxID=379532 RepID=A0A2K6G3Y5_PROCO
MFKKLKQKISEEQQQLQQALAPTQASSNSSTPVRNRSRTSSFTEQLDEGTPNKESGDTQSFAQKIQLRVPSMESLFLSPIKESLFRSSSKESLVRTSSRESLNRLDLDFSAATFDPPSDMDSEAEDSQGNSDSLSKEQLIHRLQRMERSLSSYRRKYSESWLRSSS